MECAHDEIYAKWLQEQEVVSFCDRDATAAADILENKNPQGLHGLCDVEEEFREKKQSTIQSRKHTLKVEEDFSDLRSKLDAAVELGHSLKADKEQLQQELCWSKKQLDIKEQACSEHSQNIQVLQDKCDKLVNKLKEEQQARNEALKSIRLVTEELHTLKTTNAQLVQDKGQISSQVVTLQSDLKTLQQTVRSRERERDAENIQRRMAVLEKTEMERKLDQMNAEAEAMKEEQKMVALTLHSRLKSLEDQLDHAHEEVQSNNMKIADHEIRVKALHQELSEKDTEVREAQAKAREQAEKVLSLQTQIETSEGEYKQANDRGNKLGELLVQTKKELADVKNMVKERDMSITQLREDLKHRTEGAEVTKKRITSLEADNQKLRESINDSSDNERKLAQSLESTEGVVQSLTHDLQVLVKQHNATLAENEAYKIQVDSLRQELKHQKEYCTEQEKLKHEIAQVRNKAAEEELKSLKQKHSESLGEIKQQEKALKKRMNSLQAEMAARDLAHEETIKQLTQQNKTISDTFKTTMTLMQEEHRSTVDMLQRRSDSAQRTNGRLMVDGVGASIAEMEVKRPSFVIFEPPKEQTVQQVSRIDTFSQAQLLDVTDHTSRATAPQDNEVVSATENDEVIAHQMQENMDNAHDLALAVAMHRDYLVDATSSDATLAQLQHTTESETQAQDTAHDMSLATTLLANEVLSVTESDEALARQIQNADNDYQTQLETDGAYARALLKKFKNESRRNALRTAAAANPTVTNQAVTNPTMSNSTVTNPTLSNPTMTNPTVTNPTMTNPASAFFQPDGIVDTNNQVDAHLPATAQHVQDVLRRRQSTSSRGQFPDFTSSGGQSPVFGMPHQADQYDTLTGARAGQQRRNTLPRRARNLQARSIPVQPALQDQSIGTDYEALLQLGDQLGEARDQGLRDDQLDALPTQTYRPRARADGSGGTPGAGAGPEEDTQCKVCCEDFKTGDTLRTLPCLHRYHKQCIDTWIKTKAECPICRLELKAEITKAGIV